MAVDFIFLNTALLDTVNAINKRKEAMSGRNILIDGYKRIAISTDNLKTFI